MGFGHHFGYLNQPHGKMKKSGQKNVRQKNEEERTEKCETEK